MLLGWVETCWNQQPDRCVLTWRWYIHICHIIHDASCFSTRIHTLHEIPNMCRCLSLIVWIVSANRAWEWPKLCLYTHMYIHMSYVYICACVFQFRRLLAQRVHFFSYLILLQSIYFFIARRMQNSHPSYLAIWDVLSKLEDVNHVIDLSEHTEQTIVFTIKLGCSAYVSLKQIHCVNQLMSTQY